MHTMREHQLIAVGWREWVGLPELGLMAIKAKVDTGAKTSALHTFRIEPFRQRGHLQVRFDIHPLQRRRDISISCTAKVIDRRVVRDSGGHQEPRYVILTPVRIADEQWPIEITLTNREDMLFRMLLGRTAIMGRLVVDPKRSYLLGRPRVSDLYRKRTN